ncbi:MAG TPA: carboxypeptidase-like regulatory domain-containing protein [Bryobacteraceae bacterium]|nr:carboxypeptidase-like regulatory domain-containing protein [Bryobacteraceae bacterium]
MSNADYGSRLGIASSLGIASRLFCLFCVLQAGALQAQTFYGSIVGSATDPSGSSVPGAEVTLVNTATADRRTTQTNSDGNFDFVNLVPGHYRLDVQKTGFKHVTHEDIEVQVQATVRADAGMQLGDVTQTVEVSAQAALLQTETSSLGTVVDQRKVQEMPLNGRNVLNLVTLVPGVVAQGQSMQNPTGQNIFSFGNFQIGGGIAGQNATFLDGAPLNVAQGSLIALIPTQDATQEFKVQTNSLGPEFGRFAGGVINLTSKSGTNEFHIGMYEFLRNKVLNANTFFNNSSGKPRPAFTQNQYGANIGGPIVKDKTFFFFAWEGFRLRQGSPYLLAVPTAQQRNGDFSNTRSANGNLITIYDPRTNNCTGAATCGTGVIRSAFPGNVIPTTRLDPAARALANYWGQPNSPGLPFTNLNNYSNNANIGGDNDEYNTRIDHSISEKQRVFGRFTYWKNLSLPTTPYNNAVCQDRCAETWTSKSAVLGDTFTLTPTTILDLRLTWIRFVYDRTPLSLGTDLTQFGMPASLNDQVSFRVIPTPVVQGFTDVWTSQGPGSAIHQRNDSYGLYPSVTKLAGSHNIKIGGEVRRQITNYIQSNVGSGLYNFNNLFTSQNPFVSGGGGSGYGFASFMLGLGSDGSVVTPSPYSYRNYYSGVYASDTWQVTKKLTVNYGLRWELPFASVERYDRFTNLLPNAPSPIAQASGIPNLKGRLGIVNSPDNPSRYAAASHLNLFAPRLGFAYRMTEKTVLRAGYGIFYVQNDGTGGNQLTSVTQPWVPTVDNSFTAATTLSNPWPTGLIQPPQRNPNYQTLFLGNSITSPVLGGASQHFSNMQQWNVNVERELLPGMALEMAYAGSKGTHLVSGGPQLNQLPDQYLSLGTAVLQRQVPNPFYNLIPFGTLSAPTVAYGQLLRPYPQYNNVAAGNDGNRDSIYHSLQVKLEKRFRQGGTVLAAYTWSKNIGNVETGMNWLEAGPLATIQNNNNLRQERAISGFDVAHRAIFSYVYDLPFGKGRKFLSGASGISDKLVSGWGINGISTFQGGFPLTLTTSTNSTNSFGGGSRPNFVGGCDPATTGSAQQRVTAWFNAACFSAPPASTFGNLGRTFTGVRTAGIAQYDFSVFKAISVTERLKIQFRTEFFNIFNRVQFGPPGQVRGNAQFGVVSTQLNPPRLVQFALRMNY